MTALPDYLQDQTEEAIMDRMLARLPADVDKSEGSFFWDALAPIAYELFNSAVWAQEVLRRGFASTTFGAYLDLRGEEHGIARREAQKATGSVKITGAEGTVIPAGTLLATEADSATNSASVEFATDADMAIGPSGTALVAVTAAEAGARGNVAALAVKLTMIAIAGVTAVSNEAAMSGGSDIESDEELLVRLLAKIRQPATSGNAAQYRQWALEVPGVGDARVFPLWDGPGTVKLVLADAQRLPANSALVEETRDYVESVRPIGATVTVAPAAAKTVNVAATVSLAAGYSLQEVKDSYEALVADYFRETVFKNSYVSNAKLGTLLLGVPGVLDYSELTVNGAATNAPLADEEIPVLGSVELGV
ncbi:baseplate J/gp47 family protein [Cohnella fermenti]|uniref:Baseplate J/gp47 family protein n=1 Tax=Cohnella fermenti TaxID=2565925 RepID=A0A4S4BU10_9BACL|nr:baseplate J/gp47 family protein [Cohnella fermenti]THF78020.1 baseplate J/gp47 family protein [Cohnella fermenti]